MMENVKAMNKQQLLEYLKNCKYWVQDGLADEDEEDLATWCDNPEAFVETAYILGFVED